MVKALIEIMLGDVGRFLLAQYNEYHLSINLIVIAYGILSIWAHLNLRRVTRQMEALIIDLAKHSASPLDVQQLFELFNNRWKDSSATQKVFLPTRNDLWFSMVNRANLVKHLNLQKEFVYVVLSKAGLLEPSDALPKQIYRVWELYRHQLLTGIRARHLEPDVQLKIRENQNSQKTNLSEESANGKGY
jgi:hypothetical protein